MHTALVALFDAVLQFARTQDALYMSLLEQKAAARQHTAGPPRPSPPLRHLTDLA